MDDTPSAISLALRVELAGFDIGSENGGKGIDHNLDIQKC
jgi:hypothetical protein